VWDKKKVNKINIFFKKIFGERFFEKVPENPGLKTSYQVCQVFDNCLLTEKSTFVIIKL